MEKQFNELMTKTLFRSPEHSLTSEYLMQYEYPWQALGDLPAIIRAIGAQLPTDEYDRIGESVWISKRATIAPTAAIDGPCVIIGHGATVRHCALIRENVILGEGVNVGHCTGVKNSILFDEVQVPHYNYVGDSILGYKAHMGAGAVTSNVKSDKSPVHVKGTDLDIDTGRKKVGAMIGDGVEIGCGAVLCPGTVIGKGSTVYPLVRVRGVITENHIVKSTGFIVPRR